MTTTKTYKVMAKTNGYIAQRDILFNGRCEVVVADGLTLKEAQAKLLDMFNDDYGTYFRNWGLARVHYPYNTSTYSDGTRGYDYDSRNYGIQEETDD